MPPMTPEQKNLKLKSIRQHAIWTRAAAERIKQCMDEWIADENLGYPQEAVDAASSLAEHAAGIVRLQSEIVKG